MLVNDSFMKNNVLILFILIFIFSCKKEEEKMISGCYSKQQKTLIDGYIYPKSCDLKYSFDFEKNMVIGIIIRGDGYDLKSSESSEMYWKYAYQYGDTAFNGCYPMELYCCTELSLIDITCDKDIDDNHKAFVSLSDITEIICFSYGEYIKSGYSNDNTYIQKNLSEMNNDDYLLLGFESINLRIKDSKKLPKGEYKFFITIVTEENETVTNEITIVK